MHFSQKKKARIFGRFGKMYFLCNRKRGTTDNKTTLNGKPQKQKSQMVR